MAPVHAVCSAETSKVRRSSKPSKRKRPSPPTAVCAAAQHAWITSDYASAIEHIGCRSHSSPTLALFLSHFPLPLSPPRSPSPAPLHIAPPLSPSSSRSFLAPSPLPALPLPLPSTPCEDLVGRGRESGEGRVGEES